MIPIEEYVRNWKEIVEKQSGKSDAEAKQIADDWLNDWKSKNGKTTT